MQHVKSIENSRQWGGCTPHEQTARNTRPDWTERVFYLRVKHSQLHPHNSILSTFLVDSNKQYRLTYQAQQQKHILIWVDYNIEPFIALTIHIRNQSNIGALTLTLSRSIVPHTDTPHTHRLPCLPSIATNFCTLLVVPSYIISHVGSRYIPACRWLCHMIPTTDKVPVTADKDSDTTEEKQTSLTQIVKHINTC